VTGAADALNVRQTNSDVSEMYQSGARRVVSACARVSG
jgi:hypothetical protein